MAKKSRKKGKSKAKKAGKWTIDTRLVKALTHELRVEILGILNERIASPNELANELEEGLSQVSYHVKVLRDYECIKLVDTAPRRGAVEHYYSATSRAFLSDKDWQRLPDSIRPGMSKDMLKLIVGDAATALTEGSLDARKDRHMSRTLAILDEQGWKELVGLLKQTQAKVDQIQSKSSARLRKSGEPGSTVSVSLLGFETPERRSGKAKASKKKKAKSKAKKKRS